MSILQNTINRTAPKCEGCGNRLFRASSYARRLKLNYTAHKLARCEKTGGVFAKGENKAAGYRASQMHRNLYPHHPSSRLNGALSPKGFALIVQEHQELQGRLGRRAGGTRSEQLKGFYITQELGVIREDDEYEDPARVEEALKWHAVQIGGNGFIKFFWAKQI